MKKYTILAIIFIIISISLSIYYVVENQSSKRKEESKTTKTTPEIVNQKKEKNFVDNQIMIDLNINSTINTAEKIANEIHATISPDSIPDFQSYVLEFSSKVFETEEEILDYCTDLKKTYSEIENCSPNHLMYPDNG